MAIPIPYASEEQAGPIRHAIERAAEKTGLSPHESAIVVLEFLTGMADRLERGENVLLPAFGMFGVTEDGTRLRPSFAPSRALRYGVESVLSKERTQRSEAELKAYDLRHRKQNGRTHRRVEAAMVAARQQIEADARKVLRRAARARV